MLYDDKVILIADPYHLSGINREAFVDQQEWLLYEHVDTKQRYIKEFLFRGGDEEDDNNDDDYASTGTHKERKRSILTVTCHAGLYLIRIVMTLKKTLILYLKLVDQITFIGMDIVLYF